MNIIMVCIYYWTEECCCIMTKHAAMNMKSYIGNIMKRQINDNTVLALSDTTKGEFIQISPFYFVMQNFQDRDNQSTREKK